MNNLQLTWSITIGMNWRLFEALLFVAMFEQTDD
jgi:hypothetical protein